MQGTKPVQGFIRVVVWIAVFGLLGYLFLLPNIQTLISELSPENLQDLIVPGGILLVKFFSFWWIASTIAGMFHILPEWERLALLRLGRFAGIKGPGLFIVWPFIYSVAAYADIRIRTRKIESTATLTKDNVPVKVTAAIEFEVENAERALIKVQDFLATVEWVATEALKNTIGELELRELLGQRERIARELRQAIDTTTEDYGVNVRAVRITDIDTPPTLIEELAIIARAERSAKAKTIEAEAELGVAQRLAEAARILEGSGAFPLRQIQALLEMSKGESAMIIVYPADSWTGRMIASAAAGSQAQKEK